MRVWATGSGPTVLAVHGLGGSGRYWQGLVDLVRDRYQVVAPDLAGFGGSAKPRHASYDRTFHLANLDAAPGVEEAVAVVGHSIGGTLAALWAARHAGRVRALALAAAPFPSADGRHAWMREGRPPRGMRLAARGIRLLVPLLSLPVGVVRGYPGPIALDYGRQRLRARAPTMWWLLHDPDMDDELERVRDGLALCAVLLAQARDDRTVLADAVGRWASLLPHAERIEVPSGGHQFLIREGFDPLARWLDATVSA